MSENAFERIEPVEDFEQETRELDEMTYEPGAYLESELDAGAAEEIESAFNAVLESQVVSSAEQEGSLPVPIPKPVEEQPLEPAPMEQDSLDVQVSMDEKDDDFETGSHDMDDDDDYTDTARDVVSNIK